MLSSSGILGVEVGYTDGIGEKELMYGRFTEKATYSYAKYIRLFSFGMQEKHFSMYVDT